MATTHEPPSKAPAETSTESQGSSHESGQAPARGGFTSQGPIPPVAPTAAPPKDAPPSPSERAFGGAPTADLETGRLGADGLKAITPDQVARIDAHGPAPKAILQGTLHESWHEAKHHLLEPGGNEAARRALMAKLWEYRQWHHELILQRTQKEIGKEGLSSWASAGSTTLTSDIDVNLKGSKTEQAVAVFNRQFKADGFAHEPGVAYDVNVYALDFMHKDTFKGLAEGPDGVKPHDFAQDQKEGKASPTRVSAKEGAREGAAGGGVGTHSAMLEGRMIQADADLQRVWSLVKMRLYMSGAEWQQYVRDAAVPASTLAQVNLRYDAYMKQLEARMLDGHVLTKQADAQAQTGFAVIDHAARDKAAASGGDAENIKMAASNRIYEEKLVEMASVRTKVQRQIALRKSWIEGGKAADAEALDAAIDGNLAILRDLISECSMFANEAYLTDGGVNHVVVGLQSKVEIAQTRNESMDAFNENVADALKEIARHSSTLGEAAYKAGKYLWRMGDAAKNLGSADADVALLYTAGFKIANEIKGGDATQRELEDKAAGVMTSVLGSKATTPDALMGLVRDVAARVARTHQAELAERGQERAAPVHATPAT